MFAQSDMGWFEAIVAWGLVALVMVGAGALVIGIAGRTVDGRIGPNRLAGTRTRATLASEEAWQAGHEAGQRLSVIAGWIFVASGLGPPVIARLISGTPNTAMAWWGGLVTLGTLVGATVLVVGARRSDRAAKSVVAGSAD